MDELKKGYRDVKDTGKQAGRELDGHQVTDDIGNAGDKVRNELGDLGDDARRDVRNAETDVDEHGTPRSPNQGSY